MRIGWEKSEHWRFDLSYYDIASDLRWTTDFPFPSGSSVFTAEVDSRIFLASAYYSLKQYHGLAPYVGVGVGFSRNTFTDGKEYSAMGGSVQTYLEDETTTDLAYRIALGAVFSFSPAWKLNIDASALHIGDISSGANRQLILFTPPSSQPIGRYEFNNSWVGVVTFGISYHF